MELQQYCPSEALGHSPTLSMRATIDFMAGWGLSVGRALLLPFRQAIGVGLHVVSKPDETGHVLRFSLSNQFVGVDSRGRAKVQA